MTKHDSNFPQYNSTLINRVTPSLCLICQVRQIDASAPGGKTCSLCSEMLIKTNGGQSQESSKGNLVTAES